MEAATQLDPAVVTDQIDWKKLGRLYHYDVYPGTTIEIVQVNTITYWQ